MDATEPDGQTTGAPVGDAHPVDARPIDATRPNQARLQTAQPPICRMPDTEMRGCARPRPYNLGRRQAATDENRARMIQAARDLILTENSFAGFTIDAVAQRAGVARMTVYYQFKSKRGLLEALLDELATRGGMERMAQAFGMPEPKAALGHYFEVFGDFWSSDREVMRRLRSFSVLDREFGQGIEVRSQWRRQGALVLVTRLNEAFGHPHADSLEQAADILFTLTSFDTFDALAGENHSPAEMAPILYGIALAAFGLKTA